MDEEYYVITDLKKFSKALRIEAATILYSEIKEKDINQYITLEQCSSIIKNISHKIDGEYYINEETYIMIIEEIASQIHQSALSKLASEGIIECAWDDETEQMIFWVNNNF